MLVPPLPDSSVLQALPVLADHARSTASNASRPAGSLPDQRDFILQCRPLPPRCLTSASMFTCPQFLLIHTAPLGASIEVPTSGPTSQACLGLDLWAGSGGSPEGRRADGSPTPGTPLPRLQPLCRTPGSSDTLLASPFPCLLSCIRGFAAMSPLPLLPWDHSSLCCPRVSDGVTSRLMVLGRHKNAPALSPLPPTRLLSFTFQ